MKRRLAAILGCSIALSAAMPAFADDVAGDWLFDTSKFADDCQISGRITFTQTSVKNTYNCVFESEQICGKLNFDLYIRVQQNCTAQRIGKRLPERFQPPGLRRHRLSEAGEPLLDLEPVRQLMGILKALPGFEPQMPLRRLPRLVGEPELRQMGVQLAKGLAERSMVRLVRDVLVAA